MKPFAFVLALLTVLLLPAALEACPPVAFGNSFGQPVAINAFGQPVFAQQAFAFQQPLFVNPFFAQRAFVNGGFGRVNAFGNQVFFNRGFSNRAFFNNGFGNRAVVFDAFGNPVLVPRNRGLFIGLGF